MSRQQDKKSRYFALLLYPDNDIHVSVLSKIVSEYPDHIGIWHNETEDNKRHCHLYLSFPNPRKAANVAEEIGLPDAQFCRALFGSFRDCLLYLTHINQPEKERYSTSDLFGSPALLERYRRAEIAFLRKALDMSEAVLGCIDWIEQQAGIISASAFARWACSNAYFKGVSHPLVRMALDEHNQREYAKKRRIEGENNAG